MYCPANHLLLFPLITLRSEWTAHSSWLENLMPGIQMYFGISQVKHVNYWPRLIVLWLWTCGISDLDRQVYGACVFVERSQPEVCLSLRHLIITKEAKSSCEGHGLVRFLLKIISKNFQYSSGQPAFSYSSKHLPTLSGFTQQMFISCSSTVHRGVRDPTKPIFPLAMAPHWCSMLIGRGTEEWRAMR